MCPSSLNIPPCHQSLKVLSFTKDTLRPRPPAHLAMFKWPMVASGGFFWPHTASPLCKADGPSEKIGRVEYGLRAAASMIPDKTENEQDCWEAESLKSAQAVTLLSSAYLLQHCEHTVCIQIRRVTWRDSMDMTGELREAKGCMPLPVYSWSPQPSSSTRMKTNWYDWLAKKTISL